MTAETLVQIMTGGLVPGALYALMATGLAVVWTTLGIFNVAHGAFIAVGACMAGDLTPGVGGLFNFAHVALFAVGVYTCGILARTLGVSPWLALPAGGLAAALVAALMASPVLRLDGIHAILVTLAVSQLLYQRVVSQSHVTGGTSGMVTLPAPSAFGYRFTADGRIGYYYAALALAAASVAFLHAVLRSRLGRAVVALRDAMYGAIARGVPEARTRLPALVAPAVPTGIAGAFCAAYVRVASPDIFGLGVMTIVLSILLVGGAGTLRGPVVAAPAVTRLSAALADLGAWRNVLVAVVIITVVVFYPGGLRAAVHEGREIATTARAAFRASRNRRLRAAERQALTRGATGTMLDTPHGCIAVADSGGDGPPLLFIHGNSARKEAFTKQFAAFRDRHRAVAFDLPGHGVSSNADPETSCNVPAYDAVAETVIARLGLVRPVVFGRSLGGYVALQLAARGRVPLAGRAICGTAPLALVPDDFAAGYDATSHLVLAGKQHFTPAETARFAGSATAPLSSESRFLHRNLPRTDGPARAYMITKLPVVDWPRQMRMLREGRLPFALLDAADDPFLNHAWIAGLPYGAIDTGAPVSIPQGRHAPFFNAPGPSMRRWPISSPSAAQAEAPRRRPRKRPRRHSGGAQAPCARVHLANAANRPICRPVGDTGAATRMPSATAESEIAPVRRGAGRVGRRAVVACGAACAALAALPRMAGAQDGAAGAPFSFDLLTETMRTLAAARHVPPPRPDSAFAALGYDDWRLVQFRPERARWDTTGSDWRVQAFPLGWLYAEPVSLFEVSDGIARPMPFGIEDFRLNNDLSLRMPADAALPGIAGFRLHFPLNRPDVLDEVVAFVGASYFRALGRGSQYGASARGIAVDTATDAPEEFPRFAAFWLERPAPGAEAVTVHAALEGPSLTGAYRFVIRPGAATEMDVTARLFFRDDIGELGIAPLTSMFLFAEKNRGAFDDYRPNVHDSNGLRIERSDGDVLWRPLNNPPVLAGSYFAETAPRAFGLCQRDRDFGNFQDPEARYERRPSVEVRPLGDWGAGAVRLVEIPTDLEVHDNIVAFWVPAEPARAGEAREFAYRLRWGDLPPDPGGTLAHVHETRSGRGGATAEDGAAGVRKFVIDFRGGLLDALPADAAVSPVAGAGGGAIVSVTCQRVAEAGVWRLVLDVRPEAGARVIELSAHLAGFGRKLTEIWLHQWVRDEG